jgi:O-antigen ligase
MVLAAKAETRRPFTLLAAQAIDWTQFSALVALLCFGSLSFGAVNTWSVSTLELGAGSLALLWLLKGILAGEVQVPRNALFPPMIAFLLVISAQLITNSTVYRYATIVELSKYVAYGIFFFLFVDSFRSETRLKSFGYSMSVFGILLALFALIQDQTSNGLIYWVVQHRGSQYGPYVNHNHYAGVMEMLVPIPLVLAITRLVGETGRLLLVLGTVLIAVTIVLSLSRGGIISFAVEIAILAVCALKRRGAKATFSFAALLFVTLASLWWLGRDQILNRMATLQHLESETATAYRLAIAKDGVRMFLQKPVLGWGLGTFPSAYPSFRSFYSNLVVDPADDDYIQLLVETGLLGFATMIWFLALFFRAGFRKLRNWEYDWAGALSLAALVGCTGIVIHSVSDSNLHIPGNAAIFYALCALGSAVTDNC